MSDSMSIFNRAVVRLHRDRAAAALAGCDFLLNAAGERLADRLDDIKRRFPMALDLGCHGGQLGRRLRGRGGIKTLVNCDLSLKMARLAAPPRLAADEEFMPFAEASFDLAMSCLSLHWVNDLPGVLVQARRILKPDGLFLASMLGGGTLGELRRVMTAAEVSVEGGLSPRISPFAEVKDAGDLLHRAGFILPVADAAAITVYYADPLKLMADLRAMGESNAVIERRKTLSRRATLIEAARLYREMFGDKDGRVPATFEIITLTAWTPHLEHPVGG